MSKLVGAFGTGHILMSRGTAGEAGERAFVGMQELGRRVAALNPDVLIIVSSDHFYNFHGNEPNGFLLGSAEQFETFGDMDIPVQKVPGAAQLANRVLELAQAADFPLVTLAESYKPDHGVMLPYLMTGLDQVRMIPIITNLGLDSVPSMEQGWALGELIRQAIESDGQDQRIAILGTGGLSHWLGVPEMGRVNPVFDHEVMDLLVSGQGNKLAHWSSEYILENGGNGGLEIVNWAVMAGTAPTAKGEQVYYEELPQWMSGLGGVELFVKAGE